MQLTEHRNEHHLFLRHADGASVTIVDRQVEHSVVVGTDRALENFGARTVDEIDATAIAAILAFEPEVVLLGTGARAIFPPAAVLGEFLKRGIGLETMDNTAAARTFNVLAGEGRLVVAVFLLAG